MRRALPGAGRIASYGRARAAKLLADVTGDVRFTGGRLVRTPPSDLLARLAEYGIRT